MNYIVHRRFKEKAICGNVNIPALSICECIDGMLYYNGNLLCAAVSENAHQYFAKNDDGNGLERGKLTQRIQKKLSTRDDSYQDRWDKIWEDELCQKFKRKEHGDFWVWNHYFFNAPIEDLRHIANLVGA